MTKKKGQEVIVHEETQVDLEQAIDTAKMAEHSQQIMAAYGEGLPYDCFRIVHEARFYMSQSAEAMLEAGKRLVILKEHEPHGEFTSIVENQLGMAERTARLMMQAAIKYSSPQLNSKRQALAVLGKTKLFELMTEDDDQLAELVDGGTIAGMNLDDIDRMSTRELRAALREAKEDNSAKSEVIASKSGKIDELQTKLRKIRKISPDEELLQARKEVAAIQGDIEANIRVQLRSAFNQLQELADHTGTTDHLDFVTSQLDLLDRALLQVRAELGIERSANSGAEWEQNDKDAA